MQRALRIATRGSALARWQASHVGSLLGRDVELVIVETVGDRHTDVPIHAIGGRGVFVKEVQGAVLEGRADIAVHSAKDLPAEPFPGLVMAGVPERDDPRDCLVGAALQAIPTGGIIATGSVRRRAQLAALRHDLGFAELRGNIDTRLAKANDFAAAVMAAAALSRLGRRDAIAEVLDPSVMLPQVGQGTLAAECRDDDAATRDALVAIEHEPSRLALEAERAFLAELGGGCDLPVGALAVLRGGVLEVEGLIASLDGHVVLRRRACGRDPLDVGRSLAHDLLDQGGRWLLAELRGAPA